MHVTYTFHIQAGVYAQHHGDVRLSGLLTRLDNIYPMRVFSTAARSVTLRSDSVVIRTLVYALKAEGAVFGRRSSLRGNELVQCTVIRQLSADDSDTSQWYLRDWSPIPLETDDSKVSPAVMMVGDELLYALDRVVRVHDELSQGAACLLRENPEVARATPLVSNAIGRRAVEQLGLRGVAFRAMKPFSSRNYINDVTTPAETEGFNGAVWARYNNIVRADYPAHIEPWSVLWPTFTMPPLHPGFVRTTAKLLGYDHPPITDPAIRGPIRWRLPAFDKFPLVYTPEALAGLPAFDVATTWEYPGVGPCSGTLVVSERGKEALTPFLHRPVWERVGTLPVGSPLLDMPTKEVWETD